MTTTNTKEIKVGCWCRLTPCHLDRRWARIRRISHDKKTVTLERRRDGYYEWAVDRIELK